MRLGHAGKQVGSRTRAGTLLRRTHHGSRRVNELSAPGISVSCKRRRVALKPRLGSYVGPCAGRRRGNRDYPRVRHWLTPGRAPTLHPPTGPAPSRGDFRGPEKLLSTATRHIRLQGTASPLASPTDPPRPLTPATCFQDGLPAAPASCLMTELRPSHATQQAMNSIEPMSLDELCVHVPMQP